MDQRQLKFKKEKLKETENNLLDIRKKLAGPYKLRDKLRKYLQVDLEMMGKREVRLKKEIKELKSKLEQK